MKFSYLILAFTSFLNFGVYSQSVPPSNQSFESGFSPWVQDTADDLDWTRTSGTTPSSGTGPTSASDGTYYIFTESSGNYSKTFNITSPTYAITSALNFNFNYHMYGSSMGDLKLMVSTDGGVNWVWKWYMAGNKGNAWLPVSIDLSGYQGMNIKLRFSAVTGSSYTSDIALDNFEFTAQAPPPCTVVLNDENYIYKRIYQEPHTVSLTTPTKEQVIEEVTYFDGLGRPMQHVGIRQGGGLACEDIVTHIEYDPFGREIKKYLPYPDATQAGGFKTGDVAGYTKTYYHANFGTVDFPGSTAPNTNPYSETRFEASPLNRPLEQGAPGTAWKVNPTADTDHTIKFDYQTNANLEVRMYSVSLNSAYIPSLTNPSPIYYDAGQLNKTITKDENWTSGLNNTIEEFTDKNGRVILKRTYTNTDLNNDGDTIDSNEQQVPHDTYYVYDDYGNLTYVIPPKADGTTTTVVGTTKLNDLCYQYKYDHRNRLVEKKIPGKGWEYIVYNKLDQPILTQDEVQRNKSPKEWLFTKYDAFGRVIMTGIHTYGTTTTSQSTMQSVVNTYKAWEEKTTTATNNYYTNLSYPTSNLEVLTLNYYDNYTFDTTTKGLLMASGTNIFGNLITHNVKGLATGSKIKVLDRSPVEWITTISHYDNKGRVVYTGSYNELLKTIDKVKMELNFVGMVKKTETYHKRDTDAAITTIDNFTYDHVNRLTEHTQTIGTNTELIAHNTYSKTGELITKEVGNTVTSPLQAIDYTYNVRGWLKQINNPATLGTDLFSFKLNYNTIGHSGTLLFNGNIAETEWKTGNDNVLRWYSYGYDHLNRITSATANSSNYNVSGIMYDKNGNITNLTRRGAINSTSSSFGEMDKLAYFYDSGNKLRIVSDAGNDTYGFKDDYIGTSTDTSTDYTYDTNGNMLTDSNKGITAISYNHLNLPKSVSIGGGTITYIYDATGVKQRKVAGTTTTDYAGNYMYKNNVLQFFSHPEGYVENNAGTYKYHYQYKDHLGNVRLTYADLNNNGTIDPSSEILDEKNYYPFGLEHKGYNSTIIGTENNYKTYQGQELEEDLGKNTLAFQWRDYDPAIARFNKIDRFAEDYVGISPYAFTANNPVQYREIAGDSILVTVRTRGANNQTNEQNLYWGQDQNGDYAFIDTNTGNVYQGNDQFISDLTSGLTDLMNGGQVGNDLVSSLAGDQNNSVEILSSGDNGADDNGTWIRWNPNSTNGPPDGGNNQRPAFIGLGHELAHIEDVWNGGADQTPWFNVPGARGPQPVPNAEIYSTHVENQLRAENNLPLRTSYAADPSGNPYGPRLLFPNSRQSRFFDSNGNTNRNYRPIKRRKQTPFSY